MSSEGLTNAFPMTTYIMTAEHSNTIQAHGALRDTATLLVSMMQHEHRPYQTYGIRGSSRKRRNTVLCHPHIPCYQTWTQQETLPIAKE